MNKIYSLRGKNFFLKILLTVFLFVIILTNFGFNYSYPEISNTAPLRIYPKDYFRAPLDLPMYLSGTFGELRPNHFHSGIDIKTNAKQGYPVFAVADGYVSRVRIQASGFGNALYIVHPNGYASVYAHLQKYNPSLRKFARDIQYAQNTFELDTFLTIDRFPVTKGDIIGYSGNSGSSGGPHLHFEIRDAQTEEPLNPLLFGFNIIDDIPPVIQAIQVYPLNENSSVNNLKEKQRLLATGTRPNYSINNDIIINAWGTIGIGIECIDFQNGSNNNNGVYSIELKQNGERIYYSQMERFYFHHSRAINSHCDFKERSIRNRWVQKSFVEAGNPLTIYQDIRNNGRITLDTGDIYNMEYIVKDAAGNTSTTKFVINCLDQNPYSYSFSNYRNSPVFWGYQTINTLQKENVKAIFPANTFYDSILLNYSKADAGITAYSSLHSIGNKYTPIHGFFTIEITPEKDMNPYQQSKAIIINKGKGSVGGIYSKGVVKARSRLLGDFFIGVDSIPPAIKPINIINGKNMSKLSSIRIRISDNISGIKSFDGYIDNQWVLMEYDQKYNLLTYTFDEKCPPGKHVFTLKVSDHKNNEAQYRASFIR